MLCDSSYANIFVGGSGDQESKRVKFVFVVWIGESCGGMTKSRWVHVRTVKFLF